MREHRRQQSGYVFRRGKSWFVRYCDDVLQPDRTVKRKLVCKKLDVAYKNEDGTLTEYRTVASVKPFAQEILAPVNAGLLNPQSTMLVADFVEKIYLPEFVEKQLRASWPAIHSSVSKVFSQVSSSKRSAWESSTTSTP